VTILTTAEYRLFEDTDLTDPALQILLDASEIEIVRYAGHPTTQVEWLSGGQYIYLYRPASAIVSITETILSSGTVTTLATDDWELSPDGFLLRRLDTGTNPYSHWHGRVAVTYTPLDDEALRKAVQLDLIRLALSFQPGTVSERIGEWSETFTSAMDANRRVRDEIMGRLSYGPSLVVVGG
jgi:hypothetical protein